MKAEHFSMRISKICQLLGVSRQSYYQYFHHQEWLSIEQDLVLKRVRQIREEHRYMGTRKLYELLQPFLLEHQIKIGRDALFDLLSAHKLLVRRRQRKISTTNSYHRFKKWPNLIKDFIPSQINQLWVSDITYWKTGKGFMYIHLITDVYSHKIVGYRLSNTLKVKESLKALKMAISSSLGGLDTPFQLIHHSDRGIQYCSASYVKFLQDNKIRISMTENGDPRENAIAERINGIVKHEYLKGLKVGNSYQAKQALEKAVRLYNQERPHLSIGMLKPEQLHQQPNLKTKKLWKNYYYEKNEL